MEQPLPFIPLREDIRLFSSARQVDGAPTWVLHDPVRDSFFRLGLVEFLILSQWHLADNQQIIEQLAKESKLYTSEQKIEDVKSFLINNQLIIPFGDKTSQRFESISSQSDRSAFTWLLHNYLFIKIPLVHPNTFLSTILPMLRWLFSPLFKTVMLFLFASSIYLVSREWDVFQATFIHFFSLEGLGYYLSALVLVKILHEMGHALTAKYYGLPVATMGVAFLVMWPVLFTDTSHAWKLKSRRAQLHIASAGLLVELSIAVLATLVWVFAPEGSAIKGAAYFIAALSWISSILINLNPFMRFDGYYLLADWFEIDNLQPRSFALGRWLLREIIFKLGAPSPELGLPSRVQIRMAIYSYAVWIYRFFLFLGIALLVYYASFKVLGILLFVVEIAWFIVLPVSKEILIWWSLRKEIKFNMRMLISLLSVFLCIVVLFVPWQSKVDVPAIIKPTNYAEIYSPDEAKVKKIHFKIGQYIAQNQVLFELTTPELELSLKKVVLNIQNIEQQLKRAHVQLSLEQNIDVLHSKLNSYLSEKIAILDSLNNLKIMAPISGVILEQDESIMVGSWVTPKIKLSYVADLSSFQLTAYVREEDYSRLLVQNKGLFYYQDNIAPSLDVTLVKIYDLDSPSLKDVYLSSDYSGYIATRRVDDKLLPEKAIYQLNFEINEPVIYTKNITRGIIMVDSSQQSIASALYQSLMSILIRESGF